MQIFNILGSLKAQLQDFLDYVPCHLAKRTATNYFFLTFPHPKPISGECLGCFSSYLEENQRHHAGRAFPFILVSKAKSLWGIQGHNSPRVGSIILKSTGNFDLSSKTAA